MGQKTRGSGGGGISSQRSGAASRSGRWPVRPASAFQPCNSGSLARGIGRWMTWSGPVDPRGRIILAEPSVTSRTAYFGSGTN